MKKKKHFLYLNDLKNSKKYKFTEYYYFIQILIQVTSFVWTFVIFAIHTFDLYRKIRLILSSVE